MLFVLVLAAGAILAESGCELGGFEMEPVGLWRQWRWRWQW